MNSSENRIVFIEGVSPRGHVSCNLGLLEQVHRSVQCFHVGKSIASEYSSCEKVKVFEDRWFSHGRLMHSIAFFLISCRLLRRARAEKIRRVCFMSYDVSSMFLVVFYGRFLGLNLYAFEHNTIPSSFLLRVLQRIQGRQLRHLCFSVDSLNAFRKIGMKACLTEHPLYSKISNAPLPRKLLDKKKGFRSMVFCPSASASFELICAKARMYSDVLFVAKTEYVSSQANLYVEKFFQDFDSIFRASDAVYMPMEGRYLGRVSGPLFEAMSLNKPIILSEGGLHDFVVEIFPEHIHLDSQRTFELLPFRAVPTYDVSRYNRGVKASLESAFDFHV
jgi:hypothetical protein